MRLFSFRYSIGVKSSTEKRNFNAPEPYLYISKIDLIGKIVGEIKFLTPCKYEKTFEKQTSYFMLTGGEKHFFAYF